jgi:Cdc6-like AAA superfamily ATPase
MATSDYRSELLRIIIQHKLDENSPYWKTIRLLAERERLTEPVYKALLTKAEQAVRDKEDYPDYLHRTPTLGQLYPDGPPDVQLGTLLDDPSVAFGVRFDRPLHIVICGVTGFGKTTLVRVLLREIHQLNQCLLKDPSR